MRVVIIGVVIAVALTLYALVDAAMTDASRARGVGKPVWIVLIVLLPVVGALLWFFIGKGSPESRARAQAARRAAPDNDPRFTGTNLSSQDLDAHMRDLEDRLRELDNETFPGESPTDAPAGDARNDVVDSTPSATPASHDAPAPGGAQARDTDTDAEADPRDPDPDAPSGDAPRDPDEAGKRSEGDAKP